MDIRESDSCPPLFIPLKREYFEAFAAGIKMIEYRRYGGPWTERACRPGRRVTLSLGYGRQSRLYGTLIAFRSLPLGRAPTIARQIYPDAKKIAALTISLD